LLTHSYFLTVRTVANVFLCLGSPKQFGLRSHGKNRGTRPPLFQGPVLGFIE